jgi:calcium-dependent protein kinase
MRIFELLHDDKFYFVVSEFVRHGELYEHIVEKRNSVATGGLTEWEVVKVTKQLFQALNYMHKRNIVHRDIKPENILIADLESLEIKVTDFGFATYFDANKKLDEVLGSPIYMPPEIVKKELYDSKVDIWSAGVVVFILLTGTPPFVSESKEAVFK